MFLQFMENQEDTITNVFSALISSPALMQILNNPSLSEEERTSAMFTELSKDPDNARTLISSLIQSGLIDL